MLTRPTRGPSSGTQGPGPRLWRGVRRRPSPQPCRVLLCIALLAVVPQARASDDMRALFDEANVLKDGDACDAAVPLFERVAEQGAGDVVAYARYNAGICLEGLGRADEARAHYDALVDENALPEGMLSSALFRRALLDVIPGVFTREARRDLMRVRRMESGALERAQVDLQLARLDSLSDHPRAALRRVLRAGKVLDQAGDDVERDRRGAPLDWYRAEAAVIRGTLWAQSAARTRVTLRPRGAITKRIGQRAEAMSAAEGHFAVAAGFPFRWAPQALYDLGLAWLEASEDLHTLWMESLTYLESRPDDVTIATLAVWLEARVPPQFRKAAQSWELCVQSSQVLGMARDVAAQCQSQLDAIVGRSELQPRRGLSPP